MFTVYSLQCFILIKNIFEIAERLCFKGENTFVLYFVNVLLIINIIIILVFQENILNRLSPMIGTSFDIDDPVEYKKNLIKLEIYYEEFNFETIKEKQGYTVSLRNIINHSYLLMYVIA